MSGFPWRCGSVQITTCVGRSSLFTTTTTHRLFSPSTVEAPKGTLSMKYEARQLPDIPISLPTLIPTNSTVVPTNGTSLPVSVPTSVPPTSIITTTPPTSVPTSDVVSKPIVSINSTITPVSSTTVPPTTIFVIEANLTASSQPSATVTENITTIITSINGQVTTFTSHLPTSLVDSTPNTSSSPRIAIIASVTAGSIVLLCLALACVFGYRRRKLRMALAASNHKKEVKGLLDGEEFDDDDVVPMRSYRDHHHLGINPGASLSSSNMPRSISPAPSLLRSRISESGSIFREEIWPPPGFVDPIEKRSSQVDLSRIVDDVMGPVGFQSTGNVPSTMSSMPGHDQFGSIGSSYSGYSHSNLPTTSASASHERNPTAGSTSAYSQLSVKSTTPLISLTTNSDFDRPAPPPPTSYSDPFASQNDAPSMYYPSTLPPGALAPSTPGQPSAVFTQVSHGPPANNSLPPGSMHETQIQTQTTTIHSESASSGSSRLHAASTAQPKKSSPLARVLTGDARIWLGRSPNSPR